MTEFRACALCFSETWLYDKIGNDSMCIDVFGLPVRTDRDTVVTGKSQGVGVCVYVNER